MDKLTFDIVRTCFKKKKALSYKSLFSMIYCIYISSRVIKKNKYEKVILENNVPLAWCIKWSKYTGDYIYHFHNIPRINAKCKDVFHNCRCILCVSQFVAEQIASDVNPIGPIARKKLRVLYNCIDVEQFKPLDNALKKQQIRDTFGIMKDDKVVCFVGRLSEEKGIDKVLEAVIALNRQDVKLLIVGSYIHNLAMMDEYQKKLHKLAETMGDKIIFTGYIPQNEIQKIYQISDVAVLPSMWDEPAGLMNLEAMACGVPVITTDSGGIPEYVGKSIMLKRSERLTEEIAKNVERLLDNSAECRERAEYSREWVKKNFSKEDYLGKLLECIM
jgi:hypothetical protein